MFNKDRVLYVIGLHQGKPNKIVKDLKEINVLKSFFPNVKDSNDHSFNLFLSTLPSNTLFTKRIQYVKQNRNSIYKVCIPFFSSHLKIPIKIGEYVWTYQYTKNTSSLEYEVNTYWMSRVHGLNYTEDVNYTYNDRDYSFTLTSLINAKKTALETGSTRDKISDKKNIKENQSSIIQPHSEIGNITKELLSLEKNFINNEIKNLPLNSIPVVNNNTDDFVIQGSNNTIIKLTTDEYYCKEYKKNPSGKGEIVLSSGSGDYVEKSSNNLKDIIKYDNKGKIIYGNKLDILYSNVNNDKTTLSFNNRKENFKNSQLFKVYDQNYFSNKNSEGAFDIIEDASRISITQSYDYTPDLMKKFSLKSNINKFENEFSIQTKNSNIKNQKSEYKNHFYKNANKEYSRDKSPNVSIVSNNINVFSRKSNSCIRLIKEYEEAKSKKDMISHLSLDDNGDIFIDSNRIFIGSYNNSVLKESYSISLAESVFSEPLVLGNQLKEFYLETLDVDREFLDQTKTLFKKSHILLSKTNELINTKIISTLNTVELKLDLSSAAVEAAVSALPAPVSALAPQIKIIYSDIKDLNKKLNDSIKDYHKESKQLIEEYKKEIDKKLFHKDEELSLRLSKIEDNIDKILSKISKTS